MVSKRLGAAVALVVIIATSAAAGAAVSGRVFNGGGPGGAQLRCPGGMTRLGHEFNGDISVFPGDPAVRVEIEYTVEEDFFLVEDIDTGSHAGTHLDVPSHFIEGGRSLDELAAEEFVWPVYKIDTRKMDFDGPIPFVEVDDIRRYERRNGRIPRTGALVVLQTGAERFWGAEVVAQDELDNAANTDDFFDFANPGFSAEAVQWLFDKRRVAGIGSDAYGPDAAGDENFDATFTALANDGVALVALKNLDSVNIRGDLILAPTVALSDGSGFTTDPIACLGRRHRGH